MVEPATARSNMMEFRSTSLVINSEGFRPALVISTMAFPASRALRSLALSEAGMVDVPGRTRFSTSPSICMVLAVPMEGHAPKDGHTLSSISISSSSEAPENRAESRSASTTVFPQYCPGCMDPPVTIMAGRSSRIAAR